MNWTRTFAILSLTTTIISSDSLAFKLDPYSKFSPSSRSYEGNARSSALKLSPIHESLTLKAINAAQISEQYKTDSFIESLITGVRWNDDPLGMSKNRPVDWYASYTDSCRNPEEVDPDWDLLYRTHCGDMQFLHAMASSSKEPAGETRARILMWLEFTFKVASGAIDKDRRFRDLGNYLEKESSVLFKEYLTNNGRTREQWQPEWIFTLECDRKFSLRALFLRRRITELSCTDNNNKFSEEQIQNIALGSLIHVLQDSFSGSHLFRQNKSVIGTSRITGLGEIVQFGNYAEQDEGLHTEADLHIVDDAHTEGFNLTQITSKVIELAVSQRTDKSNKWDEAKHLLEALFEVVDAERPPSDIGYK